MHRLQFEDTPPEILYKITNGCGTRLFKAPDFLFESDCRMHDFGYWRGCNGSLCDKIKDRKQQDIIFLENMIDTIEAKKIAGILRETKSVYIKIIKKYYIAVRLFGWMFYNWGPEHTTLDNI